MKKGEGWRFSTEHIGGLHCHRSFLGSLRLRGGQAGQVTAVWAPAGHSHFKPHPFLGAFRSSRLALGLRSGVFRTAAGTLLLPGHEAEGARHPGPRAQTRPFCRPSSPTAWCSHDDSGWPGGLGHSSSSKRGGSLCILLWHDGQTHFSVLFRCSDKARNRPFPPSLRQSVRLWQVALWEGHGPRAGCRGDRLPPAPVTSGKGPACRGEQLPLRSVTLPVGIPRPVMRA